MSLSLPSRACGLCGRVPVRGLLTEDGRLYCARHTWCVECETAHRRPCAETVNRIVTDRVAQEQSGTVLRDLHAIGIDLPAVPLSLVPPLPNGEQGRCIKRTVGGQRSASIEIQTGLGFTRFGHCVAHEHTHALIHLTGSTQLDPRVEEGVCEMVAMVWLTNRGTSTDVLRRMWRNPHPAYGTQMREVVRRARRVGVPTVLASVLERGTLP